MYKRYIQFNENGGEGGGGAAGSETVNVSPALANVLESMEGLGGEGALIKDALKEGLAKPAGEEAVEEGGDGAEDGEGTGAEGTGAAAGKGTKKAGEGAEGETNAFGIKIKKPGEKPGGAGVPAIENFEQLAPITKKTFGFEVKDFKGLAKLVTVAEKFRKDAAVVPELQTKVQKLEAIFEQLPEEMVEGMQAFFDGKPAEEWKGIVASKAAFDFSKAADKQDIKSLVNHYYPGEFKEEDFEGDPSPAMKIAMDAAKTKYTGEKTAFDSKRAGYIDRAKQTKVAMTTSIASSVASLKQSFPDLTEKAETEVRTLMESDDIVSVFKNTDGTYKPGAAEMLMLAKYGKETMLQLMEQAANAAESRANEDILTRGADKPKPHKGGGEKPNEKIVKEIETMTEGVGKKRYY